jgi:hypothetical protein
VGERAFGVWLYRRREIFFLLIENIYPASFSHGANLHSGVLHTIKLMMMSNTTIMQ